MTEDKSLVKSEQRLQLFSSRRQPPLLVYNMKENDISVKDNLVWDQYRYSRCRLDLEIRGNSLQEDK